MMGMVVAGTVSRPLQVWGTVSKPYMVYGTVLKGIPSQDNPNKVQFGDGTTVEFGDGQTIEY